jgi:hypothetical protein
MQFVSQTPGRRLDGLLWPSTELVCYKRVRSVSIIETKGGMAIKGMKVFYGQDLDTAGLKAEVGMAGCHGLFRGAVAGIESGGQP